MLVADAVRAIIGLGFALVADPLLTFAIGVVLAGAVALTIGVALAVVVAVVLLASTAPSGAVGRPPAPWHRNGMHRRCAADQHEHHRATLVILLQARELPAGTMRAT